MLIKLKGFAKHVNKHFDFQTSSAFQFNEYSGIYDVETELRRRGV